MAVWAGDASPAEAVRRDMRTIATTQTTKTIVVVVHAVAVWRGDALTAETVGLDTRAIIAAHAAKTVRRIVLAIRTTSTAKTIGIAIICLGGRNEN